MSASFLLLEKPVIARQSADWRGERAVRCLWQMKHGERVAAVKISSARRKAARKFWEPQQEICVP